MRTVPRTPPPPGEPPEGSTPLPGGSTLPCGQNSWKHASENITLPQTSFAGGKYYKTIVKNLNQYKTNDWP